MSDSPYRLYTLQETESGDELPAGLHQIRNERRIRPTTEIELDESFPTETLARMLDNLYPRSDEDMELPTERSDRYDVVRMRGSYLENEDVRDGDYLILEYAEPEDGELAYCLVEDDEEDFHTFREYRDGDPPVVVHSPPRLDPVKRPASEVEIVGRVVGVIRKY